MADNGGKNSDYFCVEGLFVFLALAVGIGAIAYGIASLV
jgi:hypothetical protein